MNQAPTEVGGAAGQDRRWAWAPVGALVALARRLRIGSADRPMPRWSPQAPPLAAWVICSITASTEKLAGFWRGGKSRRVARNWAT